MTVTSKFLCCKYIYLTLSRSASSEVQRCWCSLPTAARVFYSMNIHYIRLARQIQPLWGWISGFIHQHLELMQTTAQQHHNNGAHLPTTEVGMFPASPDRVFPIDVTRCPGCRMWISHVTSDIRYSTGKIIRYIYSTTNRFFLLCNPS